MARVLAISSHVVRGTVGLAASVPALQRLGHEVWALPTVVLASRPGLGRMVRHDMPAADIESVLAGLEADGCFPMLDGVLTGYFVSPDAVLAAAAAIRRIKAASPRTVVLVDPVIGDGDRLYVRPETAEAIRDRLIPLADIATPNLFELAWLTGAPRLEAAQTAQAARQLGPATVIVTSAASDEASVTTLLATPHTILEHTSPRRADIPNGAGDLLAGLLLGYLLDGRAEAAALAAALGDLDRVLAASSGREVLQLAGLGKVSP